MSVPTNIFKIYKIIEKYVLNEFYIGNPEYTYRSKYKKKKYYINIK